LVIEDVERLDGQYGEAPEGSRLISCCPGLQSLDMRDVPYSAELLASLQGLSGLHTLSVGYTSEATLGSPAVCTGGPPSGSMLADKAQAAKCVPSILHGREAAASAFTAEAAHNAEVLLSWGCHLELQGEHNTSALSPCLGVASQMLEAPEVHKDQPCLDLQQQTVTQKSPTTNDMHALVSAVLRAPGDHQCDSALAAAVAMCRALETSLCGVSCCGSTWTAATPVWLSRRLQGWRR
jgi:hypothetical protein